MTIGCECCEWNDGDRCCREVCIYDEVKEDDKKRT